MTQAEYNRLLELRKKVSEKAVTEPERKEYLDILYKEKGLTQEQYESFYNNKEKYDDFISTLLVVGGSILLIWLISKSYTKGEKQFSL